MIPTLMPFILCILIVAVKIVIFALKRDWFVLSLVLPIAFVGITYGLDVFTDTDITPQSSALILSVLLISMLLQLLMQIAYYVIRKKIR